MTQKIGVFGGSGFIGSNLSSSLVKDKNEVRIFDLIEPSNIIDKHISYQYTDIRDIGNDYQYLSDYDYVFILSAFLGKGCNSEPASGVDTNIKGTCHLINSIATLKTKPIVIFPSSAMVYDHLNDNVPIPESRAISAETIYEDSKVIAESYLHSCHVAFDLQAIVLRLFTVYGPGPASAEKGHFIPIWIEQAKQFNELSIFGDGQQTIDLTHVDDVVRAMTLIMKKEKQSIAFEVINIGSKRQTSVLDIARWFKEIKPELKTKFILEKKVLPRKKYGNINKAKDFLGFMPEVPPKQGLIEFLKQKL